MPKTATQTAPPKNQETGAAPLPPISCDVKINSLRMDGNTKGTASVTLNGQFAVRGISVRVGPNGLFVSMPSRKNVNGEYFDVCFPCTKEFRAEFDKAVPGAYDRALTQSQTAWQSRDYTEAAPFEAGARTDAPKLRM